MKKTLLALAVSCLPMVSHAAAWTVPDLQVGAPGLKQVVEHQHISDGVDFYDITRGEAKGLDFILSSGIVDSKKEADYKAALDKAGIKYVVEAAPETAPNNKAMGNIIRVRSFATTDEANKVLAQLKDAGLKFSLRSSAEDGYLTTDAPFHISLLKVDLNKYHGKMKSILAQGKLRGPETVSSMGSRTHALAAINGGFFAFNEKVGDYGAPAGIYVKNGQLLREAADGRPVLVIDNAGDHSQVTIASSVSSEVDLTVNGQTQRIDGINRKPGVILNCGGFDDQPSSKVIHDFVCEDSSEVIVYNAQYGAQTPKGEGTEIVIADSGKVASINHTRGSEIKAGYQYIQLTGDSQLDLKVNQQVAVETHVKIDGKEVKLHPGMSMVSAGPTLVHDHAMDVSLRSTQGFSPYVQIGDSAGSQDDDGLGVSGKMENREGFYNGWVLRRHPRTALGVTDDNTVYAAVVFGRQPNVTEGANITEMGKLMSALNVKDAINLDGGGSSMMFVNGHRTGKSSDPTERKVSDSIVFTQ